MANSIEYVVKTSHIHWLLHKWMDNSSFSDKEETWTNYVYCCKRSVCCHLSAVDI